MAKKQDIYKCYSRNLMKFLKKNGVNSLTTGLNPKTNKNFWIYIMTDELSELLTEWTNTPSNK